MTGIQSWLDAHGLGKYAEAFAAQDITVDLLPELSDADLKELGVASLGDRKRLLKAAAAPAGGAAQPADAPAAPTPAAGDPIGIEAAGAVPAAPDAAGRGEEGERRHATVMFSDLTGYTALNEAFDPEEVEAVMARVKRAAIEVIERHGGRVNQFVGDEVMAMFGVPVARRDDAQRAVRAALELHGAVDAIAAGLTQKLGRVLSMHTGIQSGLVVARRSDSRSGDYTLTGDTVNTAARLRGLAEPGQLVVSPQVWQQVSDFFEGEAGLAVEVKGKERPLVPWRIVKERAVPKAGSRPLVGRAEEMQQFQTLVQACVQRHRGRVVFVRGDPGMGKSRLVAEFQDIAREQGMLCHASAILDFGARTGHDAMRRLVQSLLGLALDADAASRAEALEAFGQADGAGSSGLAPHAPYLYDLLDLPAPPAVKALLAAVEAPARQKSTLDALCELARQGGHGAPGTPGGIDAPLLLLVEDIHWADAWTLKQLGALAALCAKQPLLLLMCTRFAGDPSIGEWRSALHGLPVSSIDLGPLAPDDALRLAAGAASMSEALLRSCVERAEGNPLFLEQLLLNAGEEGAVSLPGSIQALIQARMDRLLAVDKNALQAAAVWGSRVTLAALRHLLGDPLYDPRALVDQFLLRPDGDELEFSHALIRDGAYGSLLHASRRQLHLSAAEWIEPRDVALAAEHYERAEDARAADAYRRAAEALAAQFKYLDALALVERGLRLAGAAMNCGPCFELKLARAQLLLETGHALDSIEASKVAIEAAQDAGQRALGLIQQASGLRIVDRIDEGLPLLDQAQPLAEQAGLTLDLSRLHHLRGNLLFGIGRSLNCQREHELAFELAQQAGSAEAQAAALGGIGDALYAQGQVQRAYDFCARGAALAREHGVLRVEVPSLTIMGWSSIYMLNLAGALRVGAQAIDVATRVGHRRGEMLARAMTAMVRGGFMGDVPAALAQLDLGLEIARTLGSRRFEGMNHLFRAILAVRSGDREAVRAHAAQVFELVGEASMPFIGPQLYGTLARVETGAARREALAKGEALLTASALSHNHFLFHDSAIESSLDALEWDEAERYGVGLEAFCAGKSVPWGDLVVARARALCRAGRGETGRRLVVALQAVRDWAAQAQCLHYLPALDAAIVRAGS